MFYSLPGAHLWGKTGVQFYTIFSQKHSSHVYIWYNIAYLLQYSISCIFWPPLTPEKKIRSLIDVKFTSSQNWGQWFIFSSQGNKGWDYRHTACLIERVTATFRCAINFNIYPVRLKITKGLSWGLHRRVQSTID